MNAIRSSARARFCRRALLPRALGSLVICCAMVVATTASASIVVQYPAAADHVHTITNGKTTSTLTPDPVENVNEFFLLNGVSQNVMDELDDATDTDFSTFTFDFATKWQNTANGTLTIDTYKATVPELAFGGAELTARYNAGAGDAGFELQWIQLVYPTHPFDPDATFNVNTAAPGANGPIPPADGMFIDPYPNDGTDTGPFYWNETEWGPHTNGNNAFGAFDLEFRDFPQLPVRVGDLAPTGLTFELYLVEWDLNNDNIFFLDGIQWGFTAVPEPSTLVLAGMSLAMVLCVGLRRKRSRERLAVNEQV